MFSRILSALIFGLCLLCPPLRAQAPNPMDAVPPDLIEDICAVTAAGSRVSTVTRGRILTQHTGLPPRAGVKPAPARATPKRASPRGRP